MLRFPFLKNKPHIDPNAWNHGNVPQLNKKVLGSGRGLEHHKLGVTLPGLRKGLLRGFVLRKRTEACPLRSNPSKAPRLSCCAQVWRGHAEVESALRLSLLLFVYLQPGEIARKTQTTCCQDCPRVIFFLRDFGFLFRELFLFRLDISPCLRDSLSEICTKPAITPRLWGVGKVLRLHCRILQFRVSGLRVQLLV